MFCCVYFEVVWCGLVRSCRWWSYFFWFLVCYGRVCCDNVWVVCFCLDGFWWCVWCCGCVCCLWGESCRLVIIVGWCLVWCCCSIGWICFVWYWNCVWVCFGGWCGLVFFSVWVGFCDWIFVCCVRCGLLWFMLLFVIGWIFVGSCVFFRCCGLVCVIFGWGVWWGCILVFRCVDWGWVCVGVFGRVCWVFCCRCWFVFVVWCCCWSVWVWCFCSWVVSGRFICWCVGDCLVCIWFVVVMDGWWCSVLVNCVIVLFYVGSWWWWRWVR